MGLSEDLERVALQERELCCRALDAQVAWKLGIRLRTLAEERGLVVVIDVRRFGQPLFYAALEGTTSATMRSGCGARAMWWRASIAVLMAWDLNLKAKNDTLLEKHGLPVADYAAHGGSFPLQLSAAGVVGSVTVSGLPQRADHELVVEALCAELGRDYA